VDPESKLQAPVETPQSWTPGYELRQGVAKGRMSLPSIFIRLITAWVYIFVDVSSPVHSVPTYITYFTTLEKYFRPSWTEGCHPNGRQFFPFHLDVLHFSFLYCFKFSSFKCFSKVQKLLAFHVSWFLINAITFSFDLCVKHPTTCFKSNNKFWLTLVQEGCLFASFSIYVLGDPLESESLKKKCCMPCCPTVASSNPYPSESCKIFSDTRTRVDSIIDPDRQVTIWDDEEEIEKKQPSLELCLFTKWPGAEIDWNGETPYYWRFNAFSKNPQELNCL